MTKTVNEVLTFVQCAHRDCTITVNGQPHYSMPTVGDLRLSMALMVRESTCYIFCNNELCFVTDIKRQVLGPGIAINYNISCESVQ